MGMYCEVEHGDRVLQSYLVRDLHRYKIGSTVPWQPDFYSPGDWVNGFSSAHDCDGDRQLEFLLVIKDFTLIEIHEATVREDGWNWKELQDEVTARLGTEFLSPPRDLWPEIAWEAKAWGEERAKSRYKRELQARLDQVRARWVDPPPKPEPVDEVGLTDKQKLFGILNDALEPKTLEEALKLAEATFAMSQFTRQALRQPSVMRRIMNKWAVRQDLTDVVRDEIIREFTPQIGWTYGERMLMHAAQYRGERMLKERDLWPTDYVEHPVGLRVLIEDGALQVTVEQLTDESAIPLQPHEVS